MNFRTTILLVVLLLILGGVYYTFVAGQDGEPATPEPTTPTGAKTADVFDPRPDINDIKRLAVERDGEPALVFERRPGDGDADEWWLVEPTAALCEKWQVDGLARNIVQLSSRSSTKPGQKGALSAAECGLEPPAAVVTLTLADDESRVLEIGKKVALSNDTYVRMQGSDEIHIAKRDLSIELGKKAREYRAKVVMRVDPAEVVEVRVIDGERTYEFSKRGADWAIDAPVKAFADDQGVSAYLAGFRTVRADDFTDTDAALCGFDAARLVIELTTETQREIEAPQEPATTQPAEPEFETVREVVALTIGGASDLGEENYYARVNDDALVFTLGSDTVAGFELDFDKLRDKRVTRVEADDIERLTLTVAGQEPVTLTLTDGMWSASGDLTALDVPAIEELTSAIQNLRALDYEDAPGEAHFYGLDEPRGVLEIEARGKVAPVVLRVGATTSSGRSTFVRVDGQPSVQVVSASRAEPLLMSPLALRSRQIFEFDRARLHRLDVTTPMRTYVLERDEGRWRHSQPEGAPVDLEGVRSLVNNLSSMRAAQVVAKGDAAAYGLDDPRIRIDFELTGPAPTTQSDVVEPESVRHMLAVSMHATGLYCQRDDEPYIYELEPTLQPVLMPELFDRELFDFAASDVAEFKVDAPGGTNQLLLDDETWVYPPDEYVKLSRAKVAGFLGELADIRVEKYFEYEGADVEKLGLVDAPVTVSIRLKSDQTITLKITQEQRGMLPRVACWVEQERSFLLRQSDIERLLQSVDQFVEMDQPAETPPIGPPRP